MTNAEFQHPYAKHKGLTQLSANIFNCFLTSDQPEPAFIGIFTKVSWPSEYFESEHVICQKKEQKSFILASCITNQHLNVGKFN